MSKMCCFSSARSPSTIYVQQHDLLFAGSHSFVYNCSINGVRGYEIILDYPIKQQDLVLKIYNTPSKKEYTLLVLLYKEWKYECDTFPIAVVRGHHKNYHSIIVDKCADDMHTWMFEQNHIVSSTLFWRFMIQLLIAIKHCHQHNIVHTDIKIDNIGITNQNITLLDFGNAHCVDGSEEYISTNKLLGSRHYTAPEVLEHKKIHYEQVHLVDYWELGVVGYIMLMREYPTIPRDMKWYSKNPDCIRFIDALMQQDPIQRLQFDDVDNIEECIYTSWFNKHF